MEKSRAEISHWAEYDYVIVNDDIERSTDALITILTAERLRRERQAGLGPFVRALMQEEGR
jgi:guanylate kinase